MLVALFGLWSSTACSRPALERSQQPPASDTPAAEAIDATPAGDLHVVVPPGTILRSGPEATAEAIEVLHDGGLFLVLERTDEAFRIERPAPTSTPTPTSTRRGDGDPPRRGWVRSAARPLKQVRIVRGRQGPQPAPEADPELLARATRFLVGGGRETSCGPYRLLTDVADPTLPETCARLVSDLDSAYSARFGVRPVGAPRGAIVLYRDLDSFRSFADDPSGYSGHAHASRGLLALYAGRRSRAQRIQTLVHELTHLLNRRALGTPLPHWLSEGLADALGDPATSTGLGPVAGLRGAEVARRRVLEVADLPDVERLTSLAPDEFDARPGARDYEQSAVLVRYLLSDDRAAGFRAFLAGVAAGEPADLDTLIQHLGWPTADASVLDRRLRRWLDAWPEARPPEDFSG